MIPRPERQEVRWSERGSTELYKGRTRCVRARTPPEVLLTLSRYRRAPRPLPKDGVSSKDLLKASPERSYCPPTNCVGIRPASLSLTIITLGHKFCVQPQTTPHSEVNVLKSQEAIEHLFHHVNLLRCVCLCLCV